MRTPWDDSLSISTVENLVYLKLCITFFNLKTIKSRWPFLDNYREGQLQQELAVLVHWARDRAVKDLRML